MLTLGLDACWSLLSLSPLFFSLMHLHVFVPVLHALHLYSYTVLVKGMQRTAFFILLCQRTLVMEATPPGFHHFFFLAIAHCSTVIYNFVCWVLDIVACPPNDCLKSAVFHCH